jgi:hypothetical protein
MNSFIIVKSIHDLNNLCIFLNRGGYNIDHITADNGVISAYTIENYTDVQKNDINNMVNTFTDNIEGDNGIKRISVFNSSHFLLTANSVYKGMCEDISDYSTLSISCISDQKGLLEIFYSNNGIDVHFQESYNIQSNVCLFDLKTITFRYYKVKYTNDYKDQTVFSLLTTSHLYKSATNTGSSVKKSVEIQEESILTGGNYRSESKKIIIQPNTTQSYTYVWPYRTSVLEMRFITEEIHRNDILNFYIGRNTVIGVTISDTVIGSNTISVSPTVVQYINLGYMINITNTLGSVMILGDVLNVSGNTLTVQNNITDVFTAGSYILMTVQPVRNYIISAPWEYNVGRSKIGSSSIPKNTNLSIEYTNTGTVAKTFVWYFDYLF